MKRKARTVCLFLLFITLLCGNVAVFTAIEFSYLNHAPFWISWGFAVGTCILAYLNLAFLRKGKLPDLIGVLAYLVYVILAVIFVYTMPEWWIVLITELVLAAVGFFLYFLSIRPRYDNAIRQEKISSLRDLCAMVEISALETADPDLREKLQKLAADIRYSDPISPPSAAVIEKELDTAVHLLPMAIRKGTAEEQIEECKRLLKARAFACMNRK